MSVASVLGLLPLPWSLLCPLPGCERCTLGGRWWGSLGELCRLPQRTVQTYKQVDRERVGCPES